MTFNPIPIKELRDGRRKFNGLNMDDPFPRLIQDPAELSRFMTKNKIIPFAGVNNASGDAMRAMLKMLSKLSPTHSGCVKAKVEMGFSGEFQIWRNGLFETAEKASGETIKDYAGAFQGITFSGVKYNNFVQDVARDYLNYGNVFIEIYTFNLGSDVMFNLRKLPFEYSYIIEDPANNRSHQHYYDTNIGTWTMDGEITPFFPLFKEHELGYKAILHIKNGTTFYGEPDSIESILNQYSEYQNTHYRVKLAANNFTGQVILEYEGDNPETDHVANIDGDKVEDDKGQGIINNFIAGTDDPQTVIISERPFGAKQMFVHEIKTNTNQDYYKVTSEIDEAQIVKAHRWSYRLMGMNVANGMNSDVYRQEWMAKYETVVASLVQQVLGPLDSVYDVYFRVIGRDDLTGYNQFIKNPLEDVYRGLGDTAV